MPKISTIMVTGRAAGLKVMRWKGGAFLSLQKLSSLDLSEPKSSIVVLLLVCDHT